MTAVTLDKAKESLGDLITQVWKDHAPVLITTDMGHPAVLVSLDDYQASDEMNADTYLRRSAENVRRINESLTQSKAGKIVVKTMEELEAME